MPLGTINRIPASVKCVSSMIVILNAKFARLLAAHANKKDGGTEEAWQESLSTFIAVFTVHAKTSQLILSNDLCKLIEI